MRLARKYSSHESVSCRHAWAIAAAVVALMTIAFPSAASAGQTRLSGFGDTMHAWMSAFPLDASCSPANCYGPSVAGSSAKYEFSYVTTNKDRVDGFDLALRRGTSYVRAELEVAELFPNDVEMSSLDVIHRDAFGNGCAVYNLSSKTIAHIFGDRSFGDSHGTVGIELATVLPSGNTTYEVGNVNLAIVAPSYLGSDADC
jgi:hypothetical protein